MGGTKHTRHGPWEWQYVSLAAAPFNLNSDLIAVYHSYLVCQLRFCVLALNCCCYRVAQKHSVHFSLRYSGAVDQSGGICNSCNRLPGIYGNVNKPCPRAAPSDSVALIP